MNSGFFIPTRIRCLLFCAGYTVHSLLWAQMNYYVDPVSGNDANPGTMEQPYATANYAIDQTSPGDTVYLQPGIYRELFVVSNVNSGTPSQPVRVVGVGRETDGTPGVRITPMRIMTPGSNGFGTWEHHAGDIYKIRLPAGSSWLQGMGNHLLRVEGEYLIPARWPDADQVVDFDRKKMAKSDAGQLNGVSSSPAPYSSQTGFYEGEYTDSDLAGFAEDSWAGAHIGLAAGQNWWQKTGVVTGNTGSTLTFNWRIQDPAIWEEWRETPGPDDRYVLWGHLQALTRPGEFFFDQYNITPGGTGPTLYVWLPDGSSPASKTVELRRSMNAVYVASGAEHVHIENVKADGGAVIISQNTDSIYLHKIETQYAAMNRNMLLSGNRNAVQISGGTHHRVTDSLIRENMGKGIMIRGDQVLVENNVVYQCQSLLLDLDKTSETNLTEGLTVRRNTLFEGGTALVSMGTSGSLIHLNHGYHYGRRLVDIAGFNSYDGGDLGGTEISYNWVHGGFSPLDYSKGKAWHGAAGIRLDGGNAPLGVSDVLIHHNVVWDTSSTRSFAIWTLLPGQLNYEDSNINVYHNTGDELLNIGGNTGLSESSELGHVFRRNLTRHFGGPVDEAVFQDNNFYESGAVLQDNYNLDPEFISPLARNYRLTPSSPVRNLGTAIPGITEEDVGAYIGAYPSGGTPWRPGAWIREEDLSAIQTECIWTLQGEKRIRIHGLPLGRSLPDSFTLRVGGRLASWISVQYFPDRHQGEGLASVNLDGLSGLQTVEVSLDGSTFAVPQQGVVSMSAVTLTAVTENSTPEAGETLHLLEVSGLVGKGETLHAFTLENMTGHDVRREPVPVVLDSSNWAALGMSEGGENLRFYDLDGKTGLQYYIESGLGTAHTLIWLLRSPDAGTEVIQVHEKANTLYYAFVDDDQAPSSDRTFLEERYGYFQDHRLLLHLAANRLADELADGDPVSSWPDLSPSGFTAQQSFPGSQPIYRDDRIHGLGVVEFAGDDRLTVNGAAGLGSGGYQFFVIYRNPDPGTENWQRLVSARNSTAVTDWQTGIALQVDRHPSTGIAIPHANPVLDTLGTSETVSRENFTIGAQALNQTNRFSGEIAEILMLSENISVSTDPELWEDTLHYLQRKWGMIDVPELVKTPGDTIAPLRVTVGGVEATDIRLLPDGRLEFVAPAYSGGQSLPTLVDVDVILPNDEKETLSSSFTYVPDPQTLNVYEGFAYPAVGVLGNGNGGFGWQGAWAGAGLTGGGVQGSSQVGITEDSMSVPVGYGAAVSGNRMGDGPEYGVRALRILDGTVDLGLTDTVYFSFLAHTSDSTISSYVLLGFVEQGSHSAQVFDVGPYNGQVVLREGGVIRGGVAYVAETDILVVGKLVSSSAGTDTLHIKQYRLSDPVEEEPVTWDLVHVFDSAKTVDRLSVETSAGKTEYVDEIRIGNRFEDVVKRRYLHWTGEAGLTGGDAEPQADADGNGMTNVVQYGFGISNGQAVPPATFPLSRVTTVGEVPHAGVRFLMDPGSSDLEYRVQYSYDLVDWNESTPAWESRGGDDTYLVEKTPGPESREWVIIRHPDPLGLSPQFLRVQLLYAPE